MDSFARIVLVWLWPISRSIEYCAIKVERIWRHVFSRWMFWFVYAVHESTWVVDLSSTRYDRDTRVTREWREEKTTRKPNDILLRNSMAERIHDSFFCCSIHLVRILAGRWSTTSNILRWRSIFSFSNMYNSNALSDVVGSAQQSTPIYVTLRLTNRTFLVEWSAFNHITSQLEIRGVKSVLASERLSNLRICDSLKNDLKCLWTPPWSRVVLHQPMNARFVFWMGRFDAMPAELHSIWWVNVNIYRCCCLFSVFNFSHGVVRTLAWIILLTMMRSFVYKLQKKKIAQILSFVSYSQFPLAVAVLLYYRVNSNRYLCSRLKLWSVPIVCSHQNVVVVTANYVCANACSIRFSLNQLSQFTQRILLRNSKHSTAHTWMAFCCQFNVMCR